MDTPTTTIRPPVQVHLVTDGSDMTRQLVVLGVSAALSIGILLLQRKLMGPDVLTTLKLRVLLGVQDYADGRITYWQRIAGKAATMYLDSRP